MPYPGEVLPITFGANMHLFVGEPLDFEPLIRAHRAAGRYRKPEPDP